MKNTILELKKINKIFFHDDGTGISILEDINIEFREGEIIGIIGRSGSGKSTLLRIITGLIPASSGEVIMRDKPIDYNESKIAMAFQTFALFPWLTIFENIALGLRAKKIDELTIKSKVSAALELIGLSGFEEAYPRELSGGMRQRVGFARAMVMDPEILVLDEPFSALDYLTADILKADLLDLWIERSISSIKTIILVTHSLEEAISLCDRVIVMSSNPGKIIANIDIDIPHPRDHTSKEFNDGLNQIYTVLTSKDKLTLEEEDKQMEIHMRYPQSPSMISLIGFMEKLKSTPYFTKAETTEIAKRLHLTYQYMIPIIESLYQLKFLEIKGNMILLSAAGNIFLDADEESRKNIIKEHLVNDVYFIKNIYHILKTTEKCSLSKDELLKMIHADFIGHEAENILEYTISWTRYAELFTYDIKTSCMSLVV